ncbi:MAG: hypothetical protein C0609_05080 [Deltaproteobacteria bacterium]|nr:MAG: hypothetical protein C0609_05080 [Deltaproteobacteria bacterium]
MKFIISCLAFLLIFTTTTSLAGEFGSANTTPDTPDEALFLEAAGSGDLTALKGLLEGGGVPADLINWEIAKLLPSEEAETYLARIIDGKGNSPLRAEALSLLSKRREGQGRWKDASALLLRLSELLTDEKDLSGALSRLLAALDKAGEAARAEAVAITLWSEYAHLPQADEAERYLARKTGDPFKPVPGEKIFMRGKKLLEKGSRAEAVELFTKLRPRLLYGTKFLPELDLGLGKALYLLRRYEEAL